MMVVVSVVIGKPSPSPACVLEVGDGICALEWEFTLNGVECILCDGL